MISLRRIFGLMLLFLFFEAVVAIVTTLAWPNVSVFLACLAMTALAAAVWTVFVLVTRIMMRPRLPQPLPPPRPVVPVAQPRPSFGDDLFSQELSSLVSEANRRLTGALPVNSRGELPTVSTLPLYLVIGAEGSGKTSAIVNSGLEPRLLSGEASREGTVLPTRSCNFWFAEGSVFADLSGRVVMQEAENWERAIRVLSQEYRIPKWKRVLFGRRSHSNLKGMILVCDTNAFVKSNDPQRVAAFARTINDRLQAAGAILRREFPVYVIFSKCDGVLYFPEFFSHLSEPEGRRLLGVTMPFVRHKNDSADIYADREGKRLTNYFNRLYMSLAEKRLVLLAREDEAAKKSTAYEFPRELKKSRGEFVQFLLDAFRPNPLQLGPRLRGFYFAGQRWIARHSGAVAEGTVAGFTVVPKRSDATVFFGSKPEPQFGGSPAAIRPAGAAGTIAKSVFLTDIFHNIVLKDRAGYVSPGMNTREQGYRNFAFAGAGALLLLLSLLWANSWRHNRELLNGVESTVLSTHLSSPTAANVETVSDLEALRKPLARLLDYERNGPPWSYRWGLYSGHAVSTGLDNLYFDRFRRLLLDPVLHALSTQFAQLSPSTPAPDDIYGSLKAYRMITSGECKPDDQFLIATLMPIWSDAVSTSPVDPAEALAERQMQFYVAELTIRNPYQQQIAEDSKVVSRAQAYLRELNGPDKMFRAMVEQVNHDKQGDTLSRYVPNYSEVMTGPNTIDAAYTRQGWDAMMSSIRDHKLAWAGEPCVLGSQSRIGNVTLDAETEREVEDLYIKNYIQNWRSFLGAHHVQPFLGSADAAQKLRTLADNNRSPLLGLVYMTSHNTDLASAPSGESVLESVGQAAKNKFNKGISNIWTKVGGKKGEGPALPSETVSGGKDVSQEFEPVHAVVDPANSEKWVNSKNQAYVQALEELGNSLAAMPARVDRKDPAHQEALTRANTALTAATTAYHTLGQQIPNTESGVDVGLKALLWEPITYAQKVIRTLPVVPLPPPPPTPVELAKPVIDHVNVAAQALCSSVEALRAKYPFNAAASPEATTQDLNDVFAPATGTLARFAQSPDVSKVYQRQTGAWVPNPAFPATFSQPFVQALNNMSAFSDAVYADGTGRPHFDYILTLDGTGRVPFELNVDAHMIRFKPGKTSVATRLVWPPVTTAPTRLVTKSKTGLALPTQYSGTWSIFRLLQAADDQIGGLFTFRTAQFAGAGHMPLQDQNGNPVTIQIRVESNAGNVFGRGYFSKMHCEGQALSPQ